MFLTLEHLFWSVKICYIIVYTITIVSVENNFRLLKMMAKNQFWHVNLKIA